MSHKSKKIHPAASISMIFCCLLLVGASLLYLRLRNGVWIKAPQDKNILPGTEVICYRQDDIQWADDRLGDSQYTLRSSGCLVSCIASALSMGNGIEETPGTLNLNSRVFLSLHIKFLNLPAFVNSVDQKYISYIYI